MRRNPRTTLERTDETKRCYVSRWSKVHQPRRHYGNAIRLTQSCWKASKLVAKVFSVPRQLPGPSLQPGPNDLQSGRAVSPTGDRHAESRYHRPPNWRRVPASVRALIGHAFGAECKIARNDSYAGDVDYSRGSRTSNTANRTTTTRQRLSCPRCPPDRFGLSMLVLPFATWSRPIHLSQAEAHTRARAPSKSTSSATPRGPLRRASRWQPTVRARHLLHHQSPPGLKPPARMGRLRPVTRVVTAFSTTIVGPRFERPSSPTTRLRCIRGRARSNAPLSAWNRRAQHHAQLEFALRCYLKRNGAGANFFVAIDKRLLRRPPRCEIREAVLA